MKRSITSDQNLIILFMFTALMVALLGNQLIAHLRAKKGEKTVLIGFGGDTMLGRLVNDTIDQKGFSYPWGTLLPVLKSTDLNIINLETTLTNSHNAVPKVFNFKATPDKVQTLIDGSIDVVCIANNHIGDFGKEGLLETIKTLEDADIAYVGAGKNLKAAQAPVILEKNGIRIGILGFTDNEPGWKAGPNKPGTNYVQVGDTNALATLITNLRSQVDILIVSTQWGPNMRQQPTEAFREFAHELIDAGVDIVHGHSAHIFQGIERYKNGLIMYDAGDLVDDYYVTPELRNDRSFFFLVTVDKTGVKKLKLIPTLISNMQVNIATGDDAQESLARMEQLSSELEQD